MEIEMEKVMEKEKEMEKEMEEEKKRRLEEKKEKPTFAKRNHIMSTPGSMLQRGSQAKRPRRIGL